MTNQAPELLPDATKADKRPQRYGWAPGKYLCRCHDCKEQFWGDKRAILCAPCAYMRPPNPQPRPPSERPLRHHANETLEEQEYLLKHSERPVAQVEGGNDAHHDWQSIATALHKDGTRILAWDGKEQFTCFYRAKLNDDDRPGWFDQHIRMFPTHWKPLGPSPARRRAPAKRPVAQVREAWRLIETAPKDGTHILACRIPVGIRVTINTHPPTVVHWFDDPDEPGFYTSVNERAPEHPYNPTHWQPLDALPSPFSALTAERPEAGQETKK